MNTSKKFIIMSGIILVVTLIAAAVYAFVQLSMTKNTDGVFDSSGVDSQSIQQIDTVEDSQNSDDISGGEPEPKEPEPLKEGEFYLKTLTLSEFQKRTLAGAGYDIETFVVTPAMISCARGILGDEKVDAVLAGGPLSLVEGDALMRCI